MPPDGARMHPRHIRSRRRPAVRPACAPAPVFICLGPRHDRRPPLLPRKGPGMTRSIHAVCFLPAVSGRLWGLEPACRRAAGADARLPGAGDGDGGRQCPRRAWHNVRRGRRGRDGRTVEVAACSDGCTWGLKLQSGTWIAAFLVDGLIASPPGPQPTSAAAARARRRLSRWRAGRRCCR